MKFRFCWDTDCPDWLLAEIATLSTLSSVKLRLLVAHIASSLTGQHLDPVKVSKWTGEEDEAKAKACVGGIRWILEKAAGAQVPASLLDSELQQLGLPKEHAAALTKVYGEQQSAIYNKLNEKNGINCLGGELDIGVDVKGLEVGGDVEPILQLTLAPKITDCDSLSSQKTYPSTKVCMTADQLKMFLHDLCEARQIMKSLVS